MENLGQILSGNAELVGHVVVAGGDDEFTSLIIKDAAQTVGGGDVKLAVTPIHGFDPLILRYGHVIVFRHLAVIFQCFFPSGFLVSSGEGQVADFKQLGGGEKRHIGGVVEDRV